MWLIPSPVLIVLLGGLAAIAALLFGHRATDAASERKLAVIVGVCALVVAGLGVTTRLLFVGVLYDDDGHVLKPAADRWTPISRVTAFRIAENEAFAGLFYDRVWAPIPIVPEGPLPGWRTLKTGPSSIGYQLTAPGRTLVIGGGGGRDIWTALDEKQLPVDVVELSEGNRRVVDEDMGHLSRGPYSYEGVNTTIGDGRSVLSARDTKYQNIHIGFTDTLSASSAQGYALTENNLYTIEAYHEYFRHLEPSGVLNVSRPLKLVGDEALRATVLAWAALEAWGIEDPSKHIIAIKGRDLLGPYTGTVLTSLTPFTEKQVARAQVLAKERAKTVLFAPGGPYEGPWQTLSELGDYRAFCNGYEMNVCPPTDDQPFFFSMQRLGALGERMTGYIYQSDPVSILILTLIILLALSLLAFVVPMWMVESEARPGVAALSYFGGIGLGFMLFEMALIQRLVLFLGYPTYALSVVLFSLLVFSGIGSLLSERFTNPRKGLSAVLLGTCLLIAIAAFGLQPLLRSMMALPFMARVVISMLIILPFGLGLGMAMPIGIARLSAQSASAIPYAWGINGITSVLASVLGTTIAIYFGFTVTTLVAAACYAFAFVHALAGDWAESATSTDT